MENLKHTPAPWEADTDLMHPIITGPDGANHGPMVGGESGDFIVAKFFGPDANANARLCVGAVEMKKTLESTVEALDYSIHWMDNDSPAKRKVEMSRDSAIALLARLTLPLLLLFAFTIPAAAPVKHYALDTMRDCVFNLDQFISYQLGYSELPIKANNEPLPDNFL